MRQPLDLQAAILAHLRGAGAPVSGRDLAARFLRIENADEATCHRLLAPLLTPIARVRHQPGSGWLLEGPLEAAGSPPVPPRGAARPDPESAGAGDLLDFVALAADGGGPGGSGALRVLSLLPVIEGEELQEERFPAGDLDADGTVWTEEADPVPGEEPGSAPASRRSARAGAGLTIGDLRSLVEAVGDLPMVAHRVAREVDPLRRAAHEAGLSFHPAVISAARLGHLLLGLKANHAASDLAAALGTEGAGADDCRGRARLVARSFLALVPLLKRRGITSVRALLEFQDMPAAPIDLSGRAFTAGDLKALPSRPGVYRFIDRDGQVIYVGKARNLRTRVGSYFTPSALGTAKGRAILERAHQLDCQAVASELEAALLEAALLEEHRPPLNRQFEIHERPAPYGPRRNLVVVLKDSDAVRPSCTLHFLRGGAYLKRVRGLAVPGSRGPAAAPATDSWREVADTLEAAYFATRGAGEPEPGSVLDWQIVGSFLRRSRDDVNMLDVDESRDAEIAVARLRILVEAALIGPGRTLAR